MFWISKNPVRIDRPAGRGSRNQHNACACPTRVGRRTRFFAQLSFAPLSHDYFFCCPIDPRNVRDRDTHNVVRERNTTLGRSAVATLW